MRVVQTLVVRDEADVVDAQIAYHLNAGVDCVIATDHDSRDGTTEILQRYEREGYLHLIRERGEVVETQWRTRMARLAATEHGADWVINTDADEFWMPRRGTLKEVFTAIPERVGVVWALSCHFVPRPDDGTFFAEHMTVRLSAEAALNDPTSPYRPHAKAAHRADPDVVVRFGSHRVETRLAPLPAWHPADVLHFPFRSFDQYERKTVRRAQGDKPLGQYVRGLQARDQGRVEDVYGSLVIDDDALERGRAAGSLAVDTRLRDALRVLRSEDGRWQLPAAGEGAVPTVEDRARARFGLDDATFRDAELVRLVRQLDVLRVELDAVEARPWARATRRRARG